MNNEQSFKEQRSLIKAANKIASFKEGKVVLEKSNLETIIKNAEDESTRSLPIALVSVLGADENDNHWRQRHTDWIIHHHENGETCTLPVETNASENEVNFRYIDNQNIKVQGDVYIWPRPFKINQKSSNKPKELLCWIVYVSSDHQDGALLNTFLGCASSKIVVASASEREKLAKQLKPIKKMGYSAKAACIRSSANQKSKTDAGEDFLRIYKGRMIQPKPARNEETVTLESFIDHLEDIVAKVNNGDRCLDEQVDNVNAEQPHMKEIAELKAYHEHPLRETANVEPDNNTTLDVESDGNARNKVTGYNFADTIEGEEESTI